MPSSQAKLLVADMEDDPTVPQSTFYPAQIAASLKIQSLASIHDNEKYYQALATALDEALNL